MGQQASTNSTNEPINTNSKDNSRTQNSSTNTSNQNKSNKINENFFGNLPIQQNLPSTQVFRKGIINYTDLKASFIKNQIDGYLTKDRFYDTIASFLKFDIPVISHTYLSERIFDLLDSSGDKRIQEEEFIEGMKNVFSSKEMREKCKFNHKKSDVYVNDEEEKHKELHNRILRNL